MKIPTRQTVDADQLKTNLEQQIPGVTCSFRAKNFLVVKKSATAAALVVVRKDKVIVNEGFPSIGGQLLFVLCMLLLGILIPLIVYFAAFFPAQKKIRDEVGAFIKQQYGA